MIAYHLISPLLSLHLTSVPTGHRYRARKHIHTANHRHETEIAASERALPFHGVTRGMNERGGKNGSGKRRRGERTDERRTYVIVTDVLSSYFSPFSKPLFPPPSSCSSVYLIRLVSSRLAPHLLHLVFVISLSLLLVRSLRCPVNINGAERTLATTDRALSTIQSMNDGIVRRAQ